MLPSRTRIRTRTRRTAASLVLVSLLGLTLPLPSPARAASVNFILSDDELNDASAMGLERIQLFLAQHDSFLAQYTVADGDQSKSAAQLIVEVSLQYRLNPKFILTLLQKEQSLITDPNPTPTQLDYALGYGCPSSCSSTYRGFATQLRAATRRIREDYLNGAQGIYRTGSFNGWGPGRTKVTSDGIAVTPANAATAVLFIYNPFVGRYAGGDPRYGGNSLFQQLWSSWFTRRYPDGSLLRVAGTPGIWLIRSGQRSPFRSRAAFLANYDPAKVIVVDRDVLNNYEVGAPILYPEPSVVQLTTGGIYLIANGEKRSFASRTAFRDVGFNPEEIVRGVKPAEVAAYPKGEPITSADAFPSGRLLRSATTGGVTYVDRHNLRHAVYSKEVFRSQFNGQRPTTVPDEVMEGLATGDPVLFRDGELVGNRTDGTIYFISNGQRRPVVDREAFRELGFKDRNVIWTNARSVDVHPLGLPLSDVALAST